MKTIFLFVISKTFLSFSSCSLSIKIPSKSSPELNLSPVSFDSGSPSPLKSPLRSFREKNVVTINEILSFNTVELGSASEEDRDICFEGAMKVSSKMEYCENSSIIKDAIPPKPILKMRVLSEKHDSIINLFSNGSVRDLKIFYAQGILLSQSDQRVNEMLQQLIETGNFEKLKVIYKFDKVKLTDFIIKSMKDSPDCNQKTLLNLTLALLPSANEELLSTLLSKVSEFNSNEVKVLFYLNAFKYDTAQAYKMLTELLESGSMLMAKILIEKYHVNEALEPLIIYSARNDCEEAFLNILRFEPSEIERLDSNNCSLAYHAASEGNIDVLNAIKEFMVGKKIKGKGPLIGAAVKNQEESLEFILKNGDFFQSSMEEIEDCALESAVHGNFSILQALLKKTQLNLYAHRGSTTLLSAALTNEKIGYARLLIEKLNYNVNFVGEDSINPNGHALRFVLTKLGITELLLKRGANQNILIPVAPESSGPSEWITLQNYLDTRGNEKLVNLLNKYKA